MMHRGTSWANGLLAGVAILGLQEPFNERPADVAVVMSTSRGTYDGTYTLRETARICGEVPADLNLSGERSFIVQLYPDGPTAVEGGVEDVTFGSKELVGGVKTTGKFMLNVTVTSPTIGRPPMYVLDTAQPKMSGTASLSEPAQGSVRLKVNGVNDRGQTVSLTLDCKPRK